MELEQLVREWAQVVRELRGDVSRLRAELEQKNVISTPVVTTALRTVHEVPAGHRQGMCRECEGYHPIDGAPPERSH
jgi:hypothetical protein